MIRSRINNALQVGDGCGLALIGGPCVIESEEFTLRMADGIREVCDRLGVPADLQVVFRQGQPDLH